MTETSEITWLLEGKIRICGIEENAPLNLNLKTDIEKDNYVKDKTTEVCTIVADTIRNYLTNRKMTKKEFSEKTKISKWRLKRILDGDYGRIALSDFASIRCELSGEHNKATRKVLIEKFKKKETIFED